MHPSTRPRPLILTSALLAAFLAVEVQVSPSATAQQTATTGQSQQDGQKKPAPTDQPPAGQQGGQQGGRRGGGGGGGGNMFGRMGRMGGGGFAGPGLQNQFRAAFEPDFARRDMPLFKDQLSLQEAQLAVLEQLMRDYEDAFTPAREEMQTQMQDMGRQMMAPMMNAGVQQKMGEAMQKAREQMEQLMAEKGEDLTPDERQKFFRDQMERTGEEIQKELKASGAFEEMRTSMKSIVSDFNKWRETKARLQKTLVDGLQASLNDTQKQHWPAFARFLAREKTLPHGTMSGEQVNLFLVLDEAGLSKEVFKTLTPIMDQYELELDEALRTRNEFLANNEGKFLESIAAGDADGAKRFAQRSVALREHIRDVNDRYREAIMAQLSEADAKRVRQAALAASYERIYRPTQVQRAFEAAYEIEGLEQGVLDSLHGLEQQYTTELGSLNERLMQATRKQEPTQQVDEVVRMVGMLSGEVSFTSMMRGQRDQGELGELMGKRGDMDDTYMERIKNLLTPDQFEKLPRGGGRGGQGGQGGMFGGGPGGGGFGGGGPIKLADLPDAARQRMEQYDANKDGTIDDAERTKMMEDFRSRGPGGGAGGGGGGGGRGNRGGNGGGGNGGGAGAAGGGTVGGARSGN